MPGPNSDAGKQLRALKKTISEMGILRHADMFALAEASLAAHPFVRDALVRRFPWVFVDEAQDNSELQNQLLERIFGGSGAIVQRLGDDNQAIYSDGTGDGEQRRLAWRDSLDLPQSQRLAPKMATLITPLASLHPINIVGNPKRIDRAHSVFVFTDETIQNVLPTFGDLVLEEWNGALPPLIQRDCGGFQTKGACEPAETELPLRLLGRPSARGGRVDGCELHPRRAPRDRRTARPAS